MSFERTNSGLLISDTADILSEVRSAFTNAFPGLNTDPTTPQGQLITFITEKLTEAQEQVAYMSNIFIDGGSGAYLDNWVQTFYGIIRKPASPAMVDLLISGVAGTVIPNGFKVSNGISAEFITNTPAVIGENGNVIVSAIAVNINEPQVLKNTLTTILTDVAGVERVNNPNNSTPPYAAETDAELYHRSVNYSPQYLTASVFGSGLSQIANLEGVIKVGGYENVADTPVNIKNKVLPAHSVNYIVLGGDVQNIGETLLRSKNPGCAMGGDTVVPITEPISGQTYSVSFFRPVDTALKAEITVRVDIGDNYNYTQIISDALMGYVSSQPFGAMIYPVNAITALCDLGVKILDLKMAKSDGVLSYEPLALNFTDNPVLTADNISVKAVAS